MNRFCRHFPKLLFLIFLIGILFFVFTAIVHADPPDEVDFRETFIKGQVTQITNEGMQNFENVKSYNETLKVQLLEGKEKDKVVTIGYSVDGTFGQRQRLNAGDQVIVDSKINPDGKPAYAIYEPYRLNSLWWILGIFAVFIIVIAGTKGAGALIGLAISLATISLYIVPQILEGRDPLTVCITGAVIILFLTTYIAHGISVKTTVAVIGTALSLGLAALLAVLAVNATRLFGLGNEDVYNLQFGTIHPINTQGLLLGSILIGTLGALNDITTTQAITIFTLLRENPNQHFLHLFQKGMIIGREHIASLVNTLVLAYAGTSLAIFIFFALNPAKLPWWVILNNETTMEEIIRTVVGSTALILAVPITTFFAAYTAMHWKSFLKGTKTMLWGEK